MPEIPPAGRQSRVYGRGRGWMRGYGGLNQPAGRHGRRSSVGRDRPAADQGGARGHQTATGPSGRGGEQRRHRFGSHVRQPGVGSAHQGPDRRQHLGANMGERPSLHAAVSLLIFNNDCLSVPIGSPTDEYTMNVRLVEHDDEKIDNWVFLN